MMVFLAVGTWLLHIGFEIEAQVLGFCTFEVHTLVMALFSLPAELMLCKGNKPLRELIRIRGD